MSISRVGFFIGNLSSNAISSATVTGCQIGDSIVAFGFWNGSATLTSVTSDGTDAMSAVGSERAWATYGHHSRFHLIPELTESGSRVITSTISAAPTDAHRVIAWLIRNTGGVEFDAENGSTGTTGNANTSLTTSAANAAILIFSGNNNGAPTADTGNGYTSETGAGGMYYSEASYNMDVGAAGAKTPTAIRAGATNWFINALAIKAAGGAGGGGKPAFYYAQL